MTTLDQILSRINDSTDTGANKTAADASTTGSPEAALLGTIKAISEKTASVAAPSGSPAAVPALEKMASDLAAADNEALLAQAKLAGAAFCDSFMARASSFEVDKSAKVAADASASGINAAQLEKAAHDAYLKGVADAEKRAQAEYQRGIDETLEGVHKTASEVHLFGQDAAKQVLAEIAKGA